MIDDVVAPLLHRIEPVIPDAVRVDDPQLSATLTTGAAGVAFGAATPEPAALVQLPMLWVTV